MVRTAKRNRGGHRARLNTDRVLRAAVALADEAGIGALSMRSLAAALGVVPMALYKHVGDKEELLDGMVDVIVSEIEAPLSGADWKSAVRGRILSARRALLRHPWARGVIETRVHTTPAVLAYIDSLIGAFRTGGVSIDLCHHAMHAIGSRIWGFTQELFQGSAPADPGDAALELANRYPHAAELAAAVAHDGASVVGGGCDDQFEFEFALDLLLDGIEWLHGQGWTSASQPPATGAGAHSPHQGRHRLRHDLDARRGSR
jgi:AcrR family transcriptional regulator